MKHHTHSQAVFSNSYNNQGISIGDINGSHVVVSHQSSSEYSTRPPRSGLDGGHFRMSQPPPSATPGFPFNHGRHYRQGPPHAQPRYFTHPPWSLPPPSPSPSQLQAPFPGQPWTDPCQRGSYQNNEPLYEDPEDAEFPRRSAGWQEPQQIAPQSSSTPNHLSPRRDIGAGWKMGKADDLNQASICHEDAGTRNALWIKREDNHAFKARRQDHPPPGNSSQAGENTGYRPQAGHSLDIPGQQDENPDYSSEDDADSLLPQLASRALNLREESLFYGSPSSEERPTKQLECRPRHQISDDEGSRLPVARPRPQSSSLYAQGRRSSLQGQPPLPRPLGYRNQIMGDGLCNSPLPLTHVPRSMLDQDQRQVRRLFDKERSCTYPHVPSENNRPSRSQKLYKSSTDFAHPDGLSSWGTDDKWEEGICFVCGRQVIDGWVTPCRITFCQGCSGALLALARGKRAQGRVCENAVNPDLKGLCRFTSNHPGGKSQNQYRIWGGGHPHPQLTYDGEGYND